MNNKNFYNFDEWMLTAKQVNFNIESWGNAGSKSAHDINGKLVGEWYNKYDTYDNKPKGWLLMSK